ncbi:hypothetical protein BJV78DRAFT_1285053 [Lactifluus subvellereus]|nr:hypothetical protein BJV78DRAFT_1285053 [Lactifluus subvellereus]
MPSFSADPMTIKNKFLVGYQGWFYCHGDGEPVGPGHHGWIHWFTHPVPDGGSPNIDYWPDTSQYPREELFVAPGFKHKDGKQAHLFSSRNPKTVQKHFHWMAENGVDGVFLQRFVGLCDMTGGGNEGNRRIRDEVGDNVQRAAEREGRVYAIMYDISGVDPERVQEIVEADWYHLLQEKRVLNSPNYLREDGKHVIGIWGAQPSRPIAPARLLNYVVPPRLRVQGQQTHARPNARVDFLLPKFNPGGVYLVAGTPAHWRTSDSDADSNPEFVPAWMQSFDALSPWTVGRYSDQASADAFAEDRIQGDVMFLGKWAMNRGRRVHYMPVVHPGGSGFNTSDGQWTRNAAPREGGRFLWRQIYNARKWGARTMYGAMWDEYDEGTQFLPAITRTEDLPKDHGQKYTLIAYDVDGYDVPPDWYMRIAGYGSELTKDERYIEDRFPEKELRDWPNTHPKYEVRPTLQSLLASGSRDGGSSGQGQGQSYEDWLKTSEQAKAQDEAPPPPYSLEAEENARLQTGAAQGPQPPISTRPQPAQQNSRPPPPVPPRLNSPSGTSPTPQHNAGTAPPVPLGSRPTSLATSAPQTSAALGSRPPLTGRHSRTPSPHLSPTQLAPMQSSYPGQHMSAPQPPSQYQQHGSTSPSPYDQPILAFPMPSLSPLSQPGSTWSPQATTQPTWPRQDWNYPQPSHPAPLPVPPSQASYDYSSGYDEPVAFPGAMHGAGSGDYSFPMPQPAPMLEPQQLSPGPPPPLQSRESRSRASSGDYRTSPSSARPEQALQLPYPHHDSIRPPTLKSPSPRPGDLLPPPTHKHRSRSISGSTGADTIRKGSIIQRGLGGVSAALSKFAPGK